MNNEEFLAEMKKHREEAAAANPAAPEEPTFQSLPLIQESGPQEKGLIGLILRTGFVRTKQQAQTVLIGVLVVVVGLIIWINFF